MKRKIINMLLMLITLFALAACFIACGDDGKGGIDKSDVKDVKDIEMGYTHAQVRDILGAPYVRSSMEASDTTWKYYDKSYVNISDKIDEKSDEMTKAVMNGDADKASKLTEEIMKLEQQLSNLTYKYIEINFTAVKEGDNTVYKVSDVLYDSVRNANAAVAKKAKSVSLAKVPALSDMNYTDVPAKILYTDGSYKNTYVGGYHFAELDTLTTDSKEATWNDNWGTYTATVTVDTNIPKGTVLKSKFGTGTFAATALSAGSLSDIPKFSAVIESSGTVIGEDGDYDIWNRIKYKVNDITVDDGIKEIAENCFSTDNGFESITLPENLETVGNNAFKGCKNLTTAIVPATAIAQLPKAKLKEVTIIGDGEIAANSFMNCETLEKLTIGDGITDINSFAFYGCVKLTNVTIPENITFIGSEAFTACPSLTTVYFNAKECTTPFAFILSDDKVKYDKVNYYTVFDSAVKTVIIGENVKSIPHRLFYGTSIESITVPQSVEYIDRFAFSGCRNLTTVNFNAIDCDTPDPSNALYFTYNTPAYYYYTSYAVFSSTVTSIIIGDNVTRLPVYLFASTSITSLTIPKSVANISKHAFDSCDELGTISVESGNSVYHSNGNCLINTDDKTLISGCKSSVIPTDGSVTSIGENAFYDCSGLTRIVIPNNITSIGRAAFYGCDSLTSIEIPNSVTSMETEVFYTCYSLTIYCEATEEPSDWHFWYSNSPVIWDCKKNDKDYNGKAYAVIGGIRYSLKDGKAVVERQPISISGDVVIPANITYKNVSYSVESIGGYAFMNCSDLTSVTIPGSVVNMGYRAFYNTSGLTIYCEAAEKPSDWDNSWNPNNYPVIWNYKNNNITESGYMYVTIDGLRYRIKDGEAAVAAQSYMVKGSLTIPSSVTYNNVVYNVTSIRSSAFSGCYGLTSISIPNSVTDIERGAISGCYSLTNITVQSGNTKYHSAGNCVIETESKTLVGGTRNSIIPTDGSVTSIKGAFYGCSSLTSIYIPNTVTNIGEFSFYNCTNLTAVYIPNSVTSIGSYAFEYCDKLRNVEIPNSVTSIGGDAFSYCTNLTSIEIPNSVTNIGFVFRHCSGLKSVYIPKSVTYISYCAFERCDNLTIYCEAKSEPSGWDSGWNVSNSFTGTKYPVVWDYKNK